MRKLFLVLALLGATTLPQFAHAVCEISENADGQIVASYTKHYPTASKRTYYMKGKKYTPLRSTDNYEAEGEASWYGKPFHGRQTANGEIYNMYDYTAAHPTLPIPSCVRVTNLENGKSVVVRINDRGPFKSDLGTDTSKRVIDLSMKAAVALGFREKGVASVKLEAIPVEYILRSASN